MTSHIQTSSYNKKNEIFYKMLKTSELIPVKAANVKLGNVRKRNDPVKK